MGDKVTALDQWRWRRNDAITAKRLDSTARVVQELHGAVEPPKQIVRQGQETAADVRQFRIVAVNGDYVTAARLQGTYENEADTDDQTYIAKPYLLRRTPFDGASRNSIDYTYTDNVTRTATDADSNTETQVVVPSYVVGDIIYATRAIDGGTGVELVTTQGRIAVEWLDLNVDGRAWATA